MIQLSSLISVENITYMCAKINISNGCYTQYLKDEHAVEVCACESIAGNVPCNYGSTLQKGAMENIFGLVIYATLYSVLIALNELSP